MLRKCATETVTSAAADVTEVRVRFPLLKTGFDQVASISERLGRDRSQAAEMLRRLCAQ